MSTYEMLDDEGNVVGQIITSAFMHGPNDKAEITLSGDINGVRWYAAIPLSAATALALRNQDR